MNPGGCPGTRDVPAPSLAAQENATLDESSVIEPMLPEVVVNLCRAKAPVRVSLTDSRIVTAESSPNFVRHVTFDVSGTPLAGQLKAGQSFGIIPPGTDADGKAYKLRLYSVSSPSDGEDGQGRLVSTLVKRVVEERPETHRLYLGVCSNFLCDLQPGDEVAMTGPAGKRFLLPSTPEKFNYVFFATGTGLAPFRAMTMDLLRAGIEVPVHLLVGVPYRTDYMYHDLFERVARERSNFSYRPVVSREARRRDGSKHYVHYAIGEDETLRATLAQPNTLIYVCGIKDMEWSIYRELLQVGLDDYITLRHPPVGKQPLDYTREEFRRHVRAGPRMFLEVY